MAEVPEQVEPIQPPNNENPYYLIAESFARVSFAGFVGSLAGLGLEKQQQSYQQQSTETYMTSTTTTNTSNNASKLSSTIRRFPPMASNAMKTNNNKTNLPVTWAISCILFAGILETCRVYSPTTQILDTTSILTDTNDFNNKIKRTAIVSFGDYTIGGTIAGLAGAMGRAGMQSSKRSMGIWGLTVGMGLGMVAGILEASLGIGILYLEREPQEQK